MKDADQILHSTAVQLNNGYNMHVTKRVIAAMSKFGLFAMAALVLAPTAVMAKPQLGYSDFNLSEAQIAEVIRTADAQCPEKSDDYSSTLANEPRYQTACRSKLAARAEARHNAAYERATKKASKELRAALRAEQLSWAKTRYTECEGDRDGNLGGARKFVLFEDCKLFELKRRTLWIARRRAT